MVNDQYKQSTNYLELLKPLIQKNHVAEYNNLLKLNESSRMEDFAYARSRGKQLYDQIQRNNNQKNFSDIVYIDDVQEKIITLNNCDDIQKKYNRLYFILLIIIILILFYLLYVNYKTYNNLGRNCNDVAF